MKRKLLSDYKDITEDYMTASNTVTYIANAFADKVTVLLVDREQLRNIALCFDVKTDWDMTVWGMKIEVI